MTQPSGLATYARLLSTPPQYATGWQEVVLVPAPAPGATWSRVVPGQVHERLYALTFRFVASAVVATRFPILQLLDGSGNRVAASQAGGGVVAGTTLKGNLCVTYPVQAAGTSGDTFGYLPDFIAQPGWTWLLNISNEDIGDQLDLVVATIQRFPSDITRIDSTY